MNRQRTSRPAPEDWSESVVLRSYESPLAEPETELGPPAPLPAPDGPARPPRVVPAWLVVVVLVVTGAASVASALWWQHRSRVIEVIERVQPYYSAGPDPAGCPNLTPCRVRTDLGQPLTVLARQLFADATVLSSVSVTRSDTGRAVLTSVVLRTPSGLDVAASAQCVPGAGPIDGRAASLPAAGPAQADFVVGGAPGCSVAVSAQIPRGVPVPLDQLRRLAADPQSQLSP